MLPLGETEQSLQRDPSVLFFTTACDSTIVLIKISIERVSISIANDMKETNQGCPLF